MAPASSFCTRITEDSHQGAIYVQPEDDCRFRLNPVTPLLPRSSIRPGSLDSLAAQPVRSESGRLGEKGCK